MLYELYKEQGVRSAYNYAVYKLLWNKAPAWLVNRLPLAPRMCEIETTTRCNLKCIFCEHTYWDEPPSSISFDSFKSIINQFPKLKWISLTGIGESFTFPHDYMRMMEYIKQKKIFIELYDNFYFITPQISQRLIDMGVNKILISFDATTKKTYEKIRKGSNYERVLSNIEQFLKLKQESNKVFPKVSFHFVINKMNIGEAVPYLDFVRNRTNGMPIDVVYTRLLHTFKEIDKYYVEISSDLINRIKRKASELDMNVLWNEDAYLDKPPIRECKKWIMPFIYASGHIIPCCTQNEGNRREYQKQTAMGNIFHESFNAIWTGDKYKQLKKQIRNNVVPKSCYDCPLYTVDIRGRDNV